MATARQEKSITTGWDKYGNPTSKDVSYLVTGAETSDDAFDAVEAVAPSTIGNYLRLDSYELDEYKGGNAWVIVTKYQRLSQGSWTGDVNPEPQYSFDSSGGSAKIKQAKETVWSSDGAPDMGGGINWNDDDFDGVDVIVANLVETYKNTMKPSRFNTTYKRKLARATGRVNSGKWKGWEAGEVLFLGAQASRTGEDSSDYLEVTFKFAISENNDGEDGGTELAGISIPSGQKKGWHYAWALFDQKVESEKKLPNAKAVYVDRVYDTADFTELGLGR